MWIEVRSVHDIRGKKMNWYSERKRYKERVKERMKRRMRDIREVKCEEGESNQ